MKSNTISAAPVFLDVRTDAEWKDGHVNEAVHFDLEKLLQGLTPDLPKITTIKIYCHSGKRAETARNILKKNGFVNVENVGGYQLLHDGGKKTCSGEMADCHGL